MFRPVLVTPPAVPLYSDAEVKLHLHIDSSDWDSMVTLLIAMAAARLDGASGVLNRCLVNQTWRQDFAAFTSCLRLPFDNVTSVTLKYRDASNVEQTVLSTNYEVLHDEIGAYIEMGPTYAIPTTYDRAVPVNATIVSGYGAAASSVPADIRWAGFLLIGHLFANREAVTIGETATTVPLGFDALIAPYRRVGT